MKDRLKSIAPTLSVIGLFLILTWAYLYPAFDPIWSGDLKQVMSDGTDSTTLPFQYATILKTANEHPSWLFFGAVPSSQLNPPHGFALWVPWIEKLSVLFFSNFLDVEHISTLFIALLFFLNAICMYGLARSLRWSRGLAIGLGIAWAFCPFTLARAPVHAALVGTFHIPLALWAVLALRNESRPMIRMIASLAFLLVAMSAHYFVITLAFLSPGLLLIAGVIARAEDRNLNVKTWGKNLFLALMPMFVFLGWCYAKPLPSSFLERGAIALPPSGKAMDGSITPFLQRFAAHPVDYFTGDIARGYADLNPLRRRLSEKAGETVEFNNFHERANGIRWSLWLLLLLSLVAMPARQRSIQMAILAFGSFAFWLSLPPGALGIGGPSWWLYSLVSQIRVPSRAGIFVHFGVLLSVGFFLSAYNIRKKWLVGLLFPLLMVAELPPFLQAMPLAQVRPRLPSLAHGFCGTGMYFPYVSGQYYQVDLYRFLQEMRGHDCRILNLIWPDPLDQKWVERFGLSDARMNGFNELKEEVIRPLEWLAQCLPMRWIVFDPRTDINARQKFCKRLGWMMSEPRVCQAPTKLTETRRAPRECL